MPSDPKNPAQQQRIVAIALDDKMVYAFFVLVHSLVTTNRHPFHLIVGYFEGRLSVAHQRLMTVFLEHLEQPAEIRELVPHPLFTERRHLTITTFSKFVISDAVKDAHLWIDLDTIARDGWDDFFQPLNSAPSTVALVVASKLESPHTRFDGFNAGVLGWTRAPRKAWLPELANLPEKRFSSEQHLFNTLYRDIFDSVDVRFNFLSSWHEHIQELARASIIHYSGPLKPWHLARRHAKAWALVNSSWSAWFDGETKLFQNIAGTSLEKPLKELGARAVFSGRLHMGKGALAGWVLRGLAVLGPLGNPVVWWLARR
ncbi:MAG: lipopolysaccharide biosynthesis glycosyltransferase [Pontimonas sp.]|jgi:lipopolysaccharide biosynthesis glycosyltransferase